MSKGIYGGRLWMRSGLWMSDLLFEIPDSPSLREKNLALLDSIKDTPDLFYSDTKITHAYGCPVGCKMNGGFCYNNPDKTLSEKELDNYFKEYEDRGVGYYLTFTNYKNTEIDSYTEQILNRCYREGNGVIVAGEFIKSYIESNYPEFRIIDSVTEIDNNIDSINNKTSNNLQVLKVDYNNNWEVLNSLENKENIIILVNEYCIPNCPKKREHCDAYCDYNLRLTDEIFECPYATTIKAEEMADFLQKRPHFVPRGIIHQYQEIGINHFKIQGRAYSCYMALQAYEEHFKK